MRRIRELHDDKDVGQTLSGFGACEHRIAARRSCATFWRRFCPSPRAVRRPVASFRVTSDGVFVIGSRQPRVQVI